MKSNCNTPKSVNPLRFDKFFVQLPKLEFVKNIRFFGGEIEVYTVQFKFVVVSRILQTKLFLVNGELPANILTSASVLSMYLMVSKVCMYLTKLLSLLGLLVYDTK